MILKSVGIVFLLQVLAVDPSAGRQLSFISLRDKQPDKLSLVDLSKNRNLAGRKKRYLSTTLSLLWPQVVGPVDHGVIEEVDFETIPKTLLEHRLDLLRHRAKIEEEGRLMVREYLKKLTEAQDEFYGPPPHGNSIIHDYT